MHAKARRREVAVAVDDPLYTVTKRPTSEVDTQPEELLGQSQVGQQLLCMHRRQVLDDLISTIRASSITKSARKPSASVSPS
jgi:hypothetical protein